MEMNTERIRHELAGFQATGQLYRYPYFNFIYTDGVKLMAELCKADWLVTDTAIQAMDLMNQSAFVTIDLFKEGDTAKIDYSDGNGNILHRQGYSFTDFPLETFRMYFVNNTLLLPSEY